MKRTIAVAALASLALVPAAAEAHGGKSKSKVLRGSFTLVGSDGDYVTGKFGKAHLVDGKRNDKLSVHVRRLAKRTTYTYKLQTGSCGGTEVAGWRYRPLMTSRRGVGNSSARSRTFKSVRGVKYFVAVYGPDGQIVVCARLSSKGKAHPNKSRGRDDDKGRGRSDDDKGRGQSDDDKGRGNSDDDKGRGGSDDDKSRGRSDDAPGQAEDKTRGKSDDAPRGQGRDKDKKPRR